MTIFYYILTVLIWGTTWIAIKHQVGIVAAEASVAYRFALAGAAMFLLLSLSGKLQRLSWKDQPFVLLQALCLFSCNFLCFYLAANHVVSGVLSVVFSAAPLLNVANGFLFLRRRPAPRIVAGSTLGVIGIAAIFWETIGGASLDRDTAIGLLFALLGTWFFSLGNLVSARNQARGLPLASTNAWAMLYGAVIMALFAALKGVPFNFDPSPTYVGALLYLAIPGSVIAFTAYLTVVHRLGPEKAAYMTVLFPIVALTISALFEGYHITPLAMAGLVAVLMGNVLVLTRRTPALKAAL